MAGEPNIANLRAARAYAKQDYEKQVVGQHGAARADYSDAGPPNWNPEAWEGFKAQYGFYPFTAAGPLPPTFAGAPDWVYEKMNLRKPPVTVTLGSGFVS